jgi:hypothetical protein
VGGRRRISPKDSLSGKFVLPGNKGGEVSPNLGWGGVVLVGITLQLFLNIFLL